QVGVAESVIAETLGAMSPVVVDVHDTRIRNVHAAEVAEAAVIPRVERFTPAQRAPAESAAETEAEVDTPSGAAKPGHQRGRVDRTHIDGTRSPAPISAGVDPAAVVERSVTPGRVINPGPTPGFDPDPVTVLIRSPAGGGDGNPDVSVGRNVAPGAVVV